MIESLLDVIVPGEVGMVLVGALRALVSLVAGTSGMTYRRFLPANAAASILWVGTVVILGATFGKAVASTIDRFGIALTTVVVIVGLGFLIRHRVDQRRVDVRAR